MSPLEKWGDLLKALALQFYKQAVAAAPSIVSGIIIFFAFWTAGSIFRAFIQKAGLRTKLAPYLIRLFSRTAQVTCILFGTVTALGTMGINIGALIAGLGLSSFALGFAFKDALSNILAGVSILLYRPFRIGDTISTTGLQGQVTDIDLRYTTLDSGTRKVLIPNANLFVNAIEIIEAPRTQQPPLQKAG